MNTKCKLSKKQHAFLQTVQILHKHPNEILEGSNPYRVVILSPCSAINTSHNPEPIHTSVSM